MLEDREDCRLSRWVCCVLLDLEEGILLVH